MYVCTYVLLAIWINYVMDVMSVASALLASEGQWGAILLLWQGVVTTICLVLPTSTVIKNSGHQNWLLNA